MEIDEDLGEPMEIDKDLGEPMEIDKDLREPMEIDEDLGEPMEIDEDLGEPMEIGEDLGEPMEIDEDLGEPMEIEEHQNLREPMDVKPQLGLDKLMEVDQQLHVQLEGRADATWRLHKTFSTSTHCGQQGQQLQDYTKAWEEYYKKQGGRCGGFSDQPCVVDCSQVVDVGARACLTALFCRAAVIMAALKQSSGSRSCHSEFLMSAMDIAGQVSPQAAAAGATQLGGQPDYNAAWAEYYHQQAAYYGQSGSWPMGAAPQAQQLQQASRQQSDKTLTKLFSSYTGLFISFGHGGGWGSGVLTE
ncbi:hypothetical protein MHYP_G00002180 [Metynnis hypsauchen]